MAARGNGEDIEKIFSVIIGKNTRETNEVISRLTETRQFANARATLNSGVTYWRDFAASLEDISILGTDVYSGRVMINVLKPTPIGAGAFGTIYKTEDDQRIYKRILLSAARAPVSEEETPVVLESKIRGVLVETFIQTVLANDRTIGSFICAPDHVYRSGDVKRIGLKSGSGGEAGDDINLYIRMEPIQYGFKDYLQVLFDKYGKLEVAHIAPVLAQLGETLAVARTRYGFHHNDLHCGNIMVSFEGNLKLIDYGMSCLTYGGKLYRSVLYFEKEPVPCASLDLLIFLCNFIQDLLVPYFKPEAIAFFKSLLGYAKTKSDRATHNLYDILSAQTAAGNFIHWQAYRWVLKDSIPDDLSTSTDPEIIVNEVMEKIPALNPAVFAEIMKAQIPVKISGRVGMAKTRRAQRGAGYLTDQQYFNPNHLPPAAGMFAPVVSTAPTDTMIRPILYSTFKGGRRTTRRVRGGFSPSVMGGFIPNAQAAIVPAALYLVYHTMVPKGSRGRSVLRSLTRKAKKMFSRK